MLIDEIIDLLSDEKSSLSAALLKTQVLLHKVGKKELAEWVKHELNGYHDTASLPEYRKLSAKVCGDASNSAWRLTASLIPIMHLDKKMQENLQTMIFIQPLSVIEEIASKTEGKIKRELAPEAYALFNEGLGNNFGVERVWCEAPVHDVKGIITQIRSRLLGFILELKDMIGDTEDEKMVKNKVDIADTNNLFNNAIFGPNATISIGNHNQQTVKNFQIKNDFDALIKVLSDAGIPSDEIENLKTANSKDVQKHGNASFYGETGKWYTNLLGRAGKGALGVGIDVVSETVAKALAAYIG
jgi:hypothetical protein